MAGAARRLTGKHAVRLQAGQLLWRATRGSELVSVRPTSVDAETVLKHRTSKLTCLWTHTSFIRSRLELIQQALLSKTIRVVKCCIVLKSALV
jgi:hypothetical protein